MPKPKMIRPAMTALSKAVMMSTTSTVDCGQSSSTNSGGRIPARLASTGSLNVSAT
jgi:hypothetical protein